MPSPSPRGLDEALDNLAEVAGQFFAGRFYAGRDLAGSAVRTRRSGSPGAAS
ncbi:hypothetical protein [Streptomyces sp. NPDC003327]